MAGYGYLRCGWVWVDEVWLGVGTWGVARCGYMWCG